LSSSTSRRSRGTPVAVETGGIACRPLERILLGRGLFDEAWLQTLIFDHPGVLPISVLEPGFGSLVPAATEVPCSHGYIDNLYLTPSGDIVLVEAKLWSNPQARREVVAQALDYVAALMLLDFAGLQSAVLKGQHCSAASLYELVADHPEALEEAEFIDAVSTNLRHGRMLVIALGEGIRKEAEALSSLLQSHAGAHFTFALVELAVWHDPGSSRFLCVPDTLAQTTMIERGVVKVEAGQAVIHPTTLKHAAAATSASHTITEELFYERLAALDPGWPQSIRSFLAQVEPLGVYSEFKASLNLKVDVADADKPISLGYISRNGQLWTDPVGNVVPRTAVDRYLQELATLIGGQIGGSSKATLTTNGKSAPRIGMLLPEHAVRWAWAIEEFVNAVPARTGA
jgi:hypothetical protein